MNNFRVIPTLLIDNHDLVKTTKFRRPNYIGDPRNAIKIFNEKEVDELTILDISATPNGRGPDFSLLEELTSECFMPVCYGGGVTNLEDIERLFSIGVEKVALNTVLHKNSRLLESASLKFGNQSIIASIDVQKSFFGKYEVHTESGRKNSKINPATFAKNVESSGAGEIFLNSIDRDGTMIGYDLELISQVTSVVDIPVVACSGAGKISDFKDAILAGASAVAAGSMFVYYGRHKGVLINYPKKEELDRIYE